MSKGRRIVVVQPAMPTYRRDFFRRLADHFGANFRVFYSDVNLGGLTGSEEREGWEQVIGPMRNPVPGVEWQSGAFSVPVGKGDIVTVCGAPRAVTTLVLLARCRLRGARTIWWGHYWSSTSKGWRLRLRMKLAKLAHNLLFYTDREVDWFRRDGWDFQGEVSALNNGLAIDEIARFRAPYIASERGPNLLFVGRLTEKSELTILLEALSMIGDRAAHLHVIGSGEMEQELKDNSARLEVAERITWYGSITREVEIAEIVNKCAAFVYPGQVGLSLIHAMAYGLPAIVHDNELRHMPEIAAFYDGKTGESFKYRSAQSLAEKITAMLSRTDSRNAFSAKSIDVVERGYTTEKMAARFINFVNRIEVKQGDSL